MRFIKLFQKKLSGLVVIAAIPLFSATLDAEAAEDDFAVIRKQYIDYILVGKSKIDKVEKYMQSLNADGTWSDIDYKDNKRSNWKPGKHPERIRDMAIAYRIADSKLAGQKILKDAIVLATNHWLKSNYICPNWWFNQIGVPADMADILLLMGDDMPQEVVELTIKKVVSQAKLGMTGQNSVWLAEIVLIRSLVEQDRKNLKKARDTILSEVLVTTKEGIQPDGSFHQHGPQQQFGNYGLAFESSITKWGEVLRGTSMSISDDQLAIFRNYVLEGPNWAIWKGRMDLSGCGRQLVQNCQVGKARGAPDRLKRMMLIDPANHALYEKRLADNPPEGTNGLVGNKHLWRSDMMIHRRPEWYASVKMSSERVIGAETVNSENMLGLHLGDGALYIYRTGDEYKNIQVVWDWHRLPGTTCDQSIEKLSCSKERCMLPTSFVGGASDERTGIAVLDYKRDSLVSRKAWFFEEDRIICLGTGITSDKGGPIFTSIQQSLLEGTVTGQKGEIPAGSHGLSTGDWVYHAGIGYQILDADKAVLQINTQSGEWKRLFGNTDVSPKESKEVFSLWLDHGKTPKGQHYAYIIYPDAQANSMPEKIRDQKMKILQNSTDIQAVAMDDKRVRAVFYSPGELKLPNGQTIATDTPCIVSWKQSPEGGSVFVSEPTQKKTELQLKLGDKTLKVKLPSGGEAGKTVKVKIK